MPTGLSDFPPHDMGAERACLGSMLLSADAAGYGLEALKTADFYDQRHSILFELLSAIYQSGRPFDPVIINQKLDSLNAAGPTTLGMDYVLALLQEVPTSGNIAVYATRVKEQSTRRQVMEAATATLREVYDPALDTDSLLQNSESAIFDIAAEGLAVGVEPYQDLLMEEMKYLDSVYGKAVRVRGLASGYAVLDRVTAGFQPGQLVVIAGRPSMGKTTFAVNLLVSMTERPALGALFFSLEMSKSEITRNTIGMGALIDTMRWQEGRVTPMEYDRAQDTVARLYEHRVWIEDKSSLSMSQIRSLARRYFRKEKVRVVFVDYLQLIRSPRPEIPREVHIAEVSRSLKGLAKDLEIPVVALSQLNRNPDQRPDKRPALSDLRESGAIEQDADLVLLLHRMDYYDPEKDPGELEVIVAKHRGGPTGKVKLMYAPEFGRLFDILEK